MCNSIAKKNKQTNKQASPAGFFSIRKHPQYLSIHAYMQSTNQNQYSLPSVYSSKVFKTNPPPKTTASNPQHPFPTLIYKKANRNHRHNLEIANAQTDPEPAKAALGPHQTGRFGHAQTVAIADGAADLHASSDDFEWVGGGLGYKACDAAGQELGPGF